MYADTVHMGFEAGLSDCG